MPLFGQPEFEYLEAKNWQVPPKYWCSRRTRTLLLLNTNYMFTAELKLAEDIGRAASGTSTGFRLPRERRLECHGLACKLTAN